MKISNHFHIVRIFFIQINSVLLAMRKQQQQLTREINPRRIYNLHRIYMNEFFMKGLAKKNHNRFIFNRNPISNDFLFQE